MAKGSRPDQSHHTRSLRVQLNRERRRGQREGQRWVPAMLPIAMRDDDDRRKSHSRRAGRSRMPVVGCGRRRSSSILRKRGWRRAPSHHGWPPPAVLRARATMRWEPDRRCPDLSAQPLRAEAHRGQDHAAAGTRRARRQVQSCTQGKPCLRQPSMCPRCCRASFWPSKPSNTL